jgi:hypothetical protein
VSSLMTLFEIDISSNCSPIHRPPTDVMHMEGMLEVSKSIVRKLQASPAS